MQFLLAKKSINKKNKHEYLFRGLIKCKTCHSNLEVGAKLTAYGKIIKNPIPYITCRNSQKRICPPQHLNYNKFEKEVLQYLKEFLLLYTDKNRLEKLYKKYKASKNNNISKYEKELRQLDNRISTLTNQIDSIYFDKLNHIISENDYFRYTNKIIGERDILESQKKEIVKLINNTKEKQDIGSKEEMEKVINEFLNNTSKKSLYMLIDDIEIDENKNVFINFAFRSLNETVKYINGEVEVKDLLKQE